VGTTGGMLQIGRRWSATPWVSCSREEPSTLRSKCPGSEPSSRTPLGESRSTPCPTSPRSQNGPGMHPKGTAASNKEMEQTNGARADKAPFAAHLRCYPDVNHE
jgi:hypothetical protein